MRTLLRAVKKVGPKPRLAEEKALAYGDQHSR
jgi:hypothetical protein